MNKFFSLCLIVAPLLIFSGCSKTNYDYKKLGFSTNSEMEEAFSKGYHTKKKYEEMILAGRAPVQPGTFENESKNRVESIYHNEKKENINDCDNIGSCIGIMLYAAGQENIAKAIEAAKQIAALEKPSRGDRKAARKFNAEGLNYLAGKNYAEAMQNFLLAKKLDPADEEVIGNLSYVLLELKNYSDAEKAAYDAIFLNPQRANYWTSLAVAKQGQDRTEEALQAMWLAWQFAPKKQNLIEAFDKKINEETDEKIRSLYVHSRRWLVEGRRSIF